MADPQTLPPSPPPDAGRQGEITELLGRWHAGDQEALADLLPAVYAELHRRARSLMRGERPDHTLQPTALVHEAYLRLAAGNSPAWSDRLHFFAVASRTMRRILIDHARRLQAGKRGGAAQKVPLQGLELAFDDRLADFLAIDEALDRLAELDDRKARVIELRYFGGLSVAETAEVLEVSRPTVVLDARLARAWLFRQVHGEGRAV